MDKIILIIAALISSITFNSNNSEANKPALNNASDAASQINLIAENADFWFAKDYNDTYEYCVTDLDRNGRLEVIGSGVGGSGYYSITNIYEVNDTFDGLIDCGIMSPSINFDMTDVGKTQSFQDPETGIIYYKAIDLSKSGTHIGALYLNNSVYNSVPVAWKKQEFNDPARYLNANEEEISEEEYNNAIYDVFDGYIIKEVTFTWVLAEKVPFEKMTDDMDSLYERPDKDLLIALLTESYNGFFNGQ